METGVFLAIAAYRKMNTKLPDIITILSLLVTCSPHFPIISSSQESLHLLLLKGDPFGVISHMATDVPSLNNFFIVKLSMKN